MFIKGNKLLTILEAIDVIKTRNLSLLTTDIGTWRFIGVNRETMEEVLKNLKIGPKILARRSNALWDILLATEEKAKMLTGSTLLSQLAFKPSIWV